MSASDIQRRTAMVVTLGCAKNLVDSEVMLGALYKSGYRFTSDPAAAGVIILNTCGFIRPARIEAESEIRKMIRFKKRNPETTLAIVGCYVERSSDSLKRKFPEVDYWCGVRDFDRIDRIINGDPVRESAPVFLYDHATPRAVSTPRSWAYVKISEGCSHQCSFCSIPAIKGPFRSRSVSSIVREAEILASSGVREINLISQDTTYFGRDRRRRNDLVRLLSELSKIPRLQWIRVLYGYPEEITGALLDIMKEEKFCPYLDIPFQHASFRILKKMKRGLAAPRALELLDKIRSRLPGVVLRTSLIVGFPGEGKREFREIKEFVREAEFDHLGVFTYSPEEHTAAFELEDPVPEKVKADRRDDIMNLQASISYKKNKAMIGQTMDVIFEGTLKGRRSWWAGRTRFQAPEVDGLTLVEGKVPDEIWKTPIRKVEIGSADVYDLVGKMKE